MEDENVGSGGGSQAVAAAAAVAEAVAVAGIATLTRTTIFVSDVYISRTSGRLKKRFDLEQFLLEFITKTIEESPN